MVRSPRTASWERISVLRWSQRSASAFSDASMFSKSLIGAWGLFELLEG